MKWRVPARKTFELLLIYPLQGSFSMLLVPSTLVALFCYDLRVILEICMRTAALVATEVMFAGMPLPFAYAGQPLLNSMAQQSETLLQRKTIWWRLK